MFSFHVSTFVVLVVTKSHLIVRLFDQSSHLRVLKYHDGRKDQSIGLADGLPYSLRSEPIVKKKDREMNSVTREKSEVHKYMDMLQGLLGNSLIPIIYVEIYALGMVFSCPLIRWSHSVSTATVLR